MDIKGDEARFDGRNDGENARRIRRAGHAVGSGQWAAVAGLTSHGRIKSLQAADCRVNLQVRDSQARCRGRSGGGGNGQGRRPWEGAGSGDGVAENRSDGRRRRIHENGEPEPATPVGHCLACASDEARLPSTQCLLSPTL